MWMYFIFWFAGLSIVTEGFAPVTVNPPATGVTFVKFEEERVTVRVLVVLLLQNGILKIKISKKRIMHRVKSATFHLRFANIVKLEDSLGVYAPELLLGKTCSPAIWLLAYLPAADSFDR